MENVPLSIRELDEDSSGLVLHPTESNRAVTLRALRVAAMEIAAGATLEAATAKAGITQNDLRRSGKKVRAKLEALRGDFAADSAALRELVLLTWTERAIETLDPKERLAALHEISLVPEVGLKALKGGTPPAVTELSPETLAVLDGLED